MTVAQLDTEMTGIELTHWQSFFKIEAERTNPKRATRDTRDDDY